MGSGIFSIGTSALQTAQFGLATAMHNIANANTAGYNRQRIIQVPNSALLTGSGYVGQGTHTSTIERIYSSYLTKQVNAAQTTVSGLETYSRMLGELNNLLMDDDAGLASALNGFFSGVQQVSADPSSTAARQVMVSSAEALVGRFQMLQGQIDAQSREINDQVQSNVNSINAYAKEIATLNNQIIAAESSNNQKPNDLYDQRDLLVAELNKLVSVQTTTNSSGSFNVFFGNGQPLVIGTQSMKLAAVPSSADASRLTVGVVNPTGTQELPESLIIGGSLGGILQYRSETLDKMSSQMGQIATSLALTFNAQHALGQDLLGNIGGDVNFVADFFTLGTPTVSANLLNPPGTADVSASFSPPSYSADGTFYTDLTASDYRLDFDGTNLTLMRLSDNVSWSSTSVAGLNAAMASSPQGSQGFTIAAAGTFIAGSSYLIQPTKNAAQDIGVNSQISLDVRQIAVAAPVRASASSSNGGSAAISMGSVESGYSAPAAGSPVTLAYSGGDLTGFSSYPVTVTVNGVSTDYLSGPVPYTSGASYSFSGMSFTISGTPQNGDTFIVEKNVNGVSDNRNAQLLAQLQTGKTMAGNMASYGTSYSQLVGSAGSTGSEVNTILAAQTALLANVQSARDSVSAVNLDEEAAKLIEYQQAYQAAAKMMEIASSLFESILAIA